LTKFVLAVSLNTHRIRPDGSTKPNFTSNGYNITALQMDEKQHENSGQCHQSSVSHSAVTKWLSGARGCNN